MRNTLEDFYYGNIAPNAQDMAPNSELKRATDRVTLAQWLDRWLGKYAAPRLRESTMSGYRMYAEQYIKPRLGNKKMNSITPADIQQLYTKLKKEGRYMNTRSMAVPSPPALSGASTPCSAAPLGMLWKSARNSPPACAGAKGRPSNGTTWTSRPGHFTSSARSTGPTASWLCPRPRRKLPYALLYCRPLCWECWKNTVGKKHSRSVYAGTESECEEKLTELIRQMKTEIAEARRLVSEGNWEEAMALAGQKKARGTKKVV